MAARLALCTSLGCRPDADPAGLSEAHAATVRDSVASALDAIRGLGSGPDATALGGSCSDSPVLRFYESEAQRYESAADARAALEGVGSGMRDTTGYSNTDIEALAPGLALVRSLFESTLQGAGGFAFTYGGAMTTVRVHEADGRPETIEQTVEMVTAAGGRGIAVRTDHTVEAEVERLFARVRTEQGRLDVRVNDI